MQEGKEAEEELPVLLRPYPWDWPRKEFPGFFSKHKAHHDRVIIKYYSKETLQLLSPWDEELQRRVPAVTKFWHDGDRTEEYYQDGFCQRMEFLDEDQTEVLPSTITFYASTARLFSPFVNYNVNGKMCFTGIYRNSATFTMDMAEAVEALHEWIAMQPLTKSANKK